MRKLALVLSTLMFVALAACGSGDSGDANTVATPPDDYGTTSSSPAASGAETEINDHGTKTFTTEKFTAEVEMDNDGSDFYFNPTFLKVPGGSTATIELHNEGTIQHTFTIDDLNIDEELGPDEKKTVTVDVGDAGPYEFYCRFHGGQGMRGAFQPH